MNKRSFIIICFILILPLNTICANDRKNILFINSYHTGFIWSDKIEEGFIESLRSDIGKYEIYFERMDTKRRSVEKVEPFFKEYIGQKYTKDYFDIIVTSDDNAFNFAHKYRNELFPGVTIVYCGVNNSNSEFINIENNTVGILENVKIFDLLNLIKIVHPEVENIVLIGDKTHSADIHIDNSIEILNNSFPDLKYTIFNEWTIDSLEKQLREQNENSVIIELAFHVDKNDKIISFEEEREFLTKKTDLPTYSLWSTRLKFGIVGGVMTSGNVHGRAAGRLTKEILSGKIPEGPVYSEIEYPIIFEYNQLIRHNIPLENLPVNAQIINRPDTLWYKYKSQIIIIISFLIAQTALIILLIFNVEKKRLAQKELKSLNENLEDKVTRRTKELNDSLTSLRQTQERLIESEKIASLVTLVSGVAHKVNTPLGVCVTISSFMKGLLAEKKYDDINDSMDILEKNIDEVVSTINTFKQISINMNSEVKTEIELHDYINFIIKSNDELLKKRNIVTKLNCSKDLTLPIFPGSLEKILNNLIKNSIIHGFERNIENPTIDVSITYKNETLTIKYRDNGVGIDEKNIRKIFDPFYTTKMGNNFSGLGLNIVYNEVVHRLHGTIDVDRSLNRGLGLIISFNA